jgi:hypothetical protein
MIKKIVASLLLATPALAQGGVGSIEQYTGCEGLNPPARQETLRIVAGGFGTHRLLTSGENPNSWGVLYYGFQNGSTSGPGNFTAPSPVTGLCISGIQSRSVAYKSNLFGGASVTLPGLSSVPGTYVFQRVHRESASGFGSYASGPGISAIIQ